MTSERDVRFTVGFAFLIFSVLFLLNGIESLADVRAMIAQSTTATVIARLTYTRWVWKWLPMWIHGVPLLEGSWDGTFESTGNDRTPAEKRNGTTKVTIRQPSISRVRVVRESAESRSQSSGESLVIDDDGSIRLLYTYLSIPNALVQERSPISYGTAKLNASVDDLNNLKGDYWTDQKTTGVMALSRVLKSQI